MKTKSRSASRRHFNWWKIATLSIVVLASVYFIWQFMFVINSKNSKAQVFNCSKAGKQCMTRPCCQGLKEKIVKGICRCQGEKVDNCGGQSEVCTAGSCCEGFICYSFNGDKRCIPDQSVRLPTRDPLVPTGTCGKKGNCVMANFCADSLPGETCTRLGEVCCISVLKPTPVVTCNEQGGGCVKSVVACTSVDDGVVIPGTCPSGKVCCIW